MPKGALARLNRLSPLALALAAGALVAACVYMTPRRGGNIEAQVQIPGVQAGWVSYIGVMTAAAKPDVPGAFTCFNGVDPRCVGASVSQVTGNVLAVPLVSSGPYSSVSSFLQFAPLQPGMWTVSVHIDGSAAKDFRICGVPVDANTTTILYIESDPLHASATYALGKERSGKASIC